jgi:hypothetical protein
MADRGHGSSLRFPQKSSLTQQQSGVSHGDKSDRKSLADIASIERDVDRQIEQSFPASDPPSYDAARPGVGSPKR